MEIALKFIKENLTSKINIITMKELMVYLAVGRFTFFFSRYAHMGSSAKVCSLHSSSLLVLYIQ